MIHIATHKSMVYDALPSTYKSACRAFGVEHGKQHVAKHGVVTKSYIDYNRRDVQATSELAVKLLAEYAKHPITLQPTKAYSPASIGKAYLRAMGIGPILERQPDFPAAYLGFAQTAFFGGRTSAHIRKTPVPVVYVDFLSMYPTVNGLMDLRRFLVARKVRVIEHCQTGIEKFLRTLTPERLFRPDTWKLLPAFVQLIPNGDLLPSRWRSTAGSFLSSKRATKRELVVVATMISRMVGTSVFFRSDGVFGKHRRQSRAPASSRSRAR